MSTAICGWCDAVYNPLHPEFGTSFHARCNPSHGQPDHPELLTISVGELAAALRAYQEDGDDSATTYPDHAARLFSHIQRQRDTLQEKP